MEAARVEQEGWMLWEEPSERGHAGWCHTSRGLCGKQGQRASRVCFQEEAVCDVAVRPKGPRPPGRHCGLIPDGPWGCRACSVLLEAGLGAVAQTTVGLGVPGLACPFSGALLWWPGKGHLLRHRPQGLLSWSSCLQPMKTGSRSRPGSSYS